MTCFCVAPGLICAVQVVCSWVTKTGSGISSQISALTHLPVQGCPCLAARQLVSRDALFKKLLHSRLAAAVCTKNKSTSRGSGASQHRSVPASPKCSEVLASASLTKNRTIQTEQRGFMLLIHGSLAGKPWSGGPGASWAHLSRGRSCCSGQPAH